MLRKFLLLFLLVLSSQLSAQQKEELFAKIIETGTGFPVPYATIQFKNSTSGLVSNIDGYFRIPMAFKTNSDILIISCIGYATKEVPLIDFSEKELNIIHLSSRIEELDVVIIQGKSTKKLDYTGYTLVKKAIGKIPINYPMESFSTIGYYRDYQYLSGQYYNLNEAIIETFDAGFDTDVIMDDANQSALYKYYRNNDFPRDSSLLKAYDGKSKYIENTQLSGQGGNELGILKIHDPIRNFEQLSFSFAYVFNKRFVENHEFDVLRKVFLNDEGIYEVKFKAKDDITGDYHRAEGRIFISEDSFAIHKLNYQMYETKPEALLFEVTIEYKPIKSKMYLNYITFNNRFKVRDDFQFDVTTVEYDHSEKAMYVAFNSPLNQSTVDKKDFRFKFQSKKLVTDNIEIVDSKTVKVSFADWSIPKEIDEKTDMSLFDYRIKNIYDVSQRKIFKAPKIEAYQFREYFVQHVRENIRVSSDFNIIRKSQPLSEAKENLDLETNKYWLNTPLKTIDSK